METLVDMSLPSGNSEVAANIPKDLFHGVFSVSKIPPLLDIEGELRKSLTRPIRSEPLSSLAKKAKRVLILVDDLTRPTPAFSILPLVLEDLRMGGIREENIAILFALGSHRAMSEEEMSKKVGEKVFSRVRCYNHDYKGPLKSVGRTDLGTPIHVNPLLKDYDLVLGIGSIFPHRYCGWSGGGKIVQPGICGEDTITATHLLVAKDAGICLGSESNAALDEIRSVSTQAGLQFIVNTICNGAGDVTGLVAGAPVPAHKKGIEKAKRVFGVAMPKCDVLIVSAYPEESNLWQAFKALYAAHLVVRRGGRIVLVCRAEEGVGEHPELVNLIALGTEKLQRIIRESQEGDMLCVAAAFAGSQVMEHARIDIVSGNRDLERVVAPNMGYYNSLQDAIDNACACLGKDQKILALREGPIALPILETGEEIERSRPGQMGTSSTSKGGYAADKTGWNM